MAKKKRKAAKKKKRASKGKRKSAKHKLADAMGMDPDMLEDMVRQVFPGGFGEDTDGPAGDISPMEIVQDMMRMMSESGGLESSMEDSSDDPDGVEALLFQATAIPSAVEALPLYEKAVAAGERAISKKDFREWTGHFWGVHETRPYMRAKQALAECLWAIGRHEESIEHFQDMLRLNPNDNQGIRWPLASYLVDLDRDADLARLLEEFEDESTAVWAYSKALLAFRASGDTPEARKVLDQASERNPHVPAYLLGEKEMPLEHPGFFDPQGESGAITYAIEGRSAWRNTAGALAWMREVLGVSVSDPPPSPNPARNPTWRQIKPDLLDLPQYEEEVWQVESQRAKTVIDLGDEPFKPWVFMVVNSSDRSPVAFEFEPDRIPIAEAWSELIDAMFAPESGEPRRPGKIQVRLKGHHKAWQKKLADLDIECELCEQLDVVDDILESLLETVGGNMGPTGPVNHAELAELPQAVEEAWQVAFRQLPLWVHEGAPHRPWSILIVQDGSGMVLNQRLTADVPTSEEIWNTVATTMLHPLPLPTPEPFTPHRPGALLVRDPEMFTDFASQLDDLDIRVTDSEPLDLVDEAFDDLTRHLQDDSAPPSLIEVPGVELEDVGRLYQTAAEFYRQAPWKRTTADCPILVECDQIQSGPWVAFVMGQAGMTPGLAMYENPESIEKLLANDGQAAENASAISLLYGEQFEIHPEDLQAAEQYGWPVAAPEAYPMPIRINPGRAARPTLAWEMKLLAGATKAVLDFVASSSDLQQKRKTEYKVFDDLTLRLSWPK